MQIATSGIETGSLPVRDADGRAAYLVRSGNLLSD